MSFERNRQKISVSILVRPLIMKSINNEPKGHSCVRSPIVIAGSGRHVFDGSLMTKICKEIRSKVTGVSFLFQLTVFEGSEGYS